jgi:hypothetical protein
MPYETVRDNQWWYSRSVHRPRVEHCNFVLLSIGGRECPLRHSEMGRDGRPTHSFKFMIPADREFWVGFRGNQIEIEIVDCGNELPEVDQADEGDQTNEMGPATLMNNQRETDLIQSPLVSRHRDTLFDVYIFIDWSASSRPKLGMDSIWIGSGTYDDNGILLVDEPINPRTRHQAEEEVRNLLLQHSRSHRRILVGFDFPYGYPDNWHNALGHANNDWLELWNLLTANITDDDKNVNNRCVVANNLNIANANFLGPFWSRPNNNLDLYPRLPATRPQCFDEGLVSEFREIERRLIVRGVRRARPKSVWQLFGNGVVGSQALLGIPVLSRLRNHDQLQGFSRVWPFETGWECPLVLRPFVVHAEIWPGAIPVDRNLHQVKDAAQVLSYVYWAARLDVAGNLSERFNQPNPAPEAVVQQCEGWILGNF